MTKANQFFAGSTASARAATTPRMRPPKYLTERQPIFRPNDEWISCELYAHDRAQYQSHLRVVQSSRLPAYRKHRFRVRRLSDNKIVAVGVHDATQFR